MESVSVSLVVQGHEVHHQHVLGVRIQTAQPHLEGREHPPSRLGHYHLRSEGMELVPEGLHLEESPGRAQGRVQGGMTVEKRVRVEQGSLWNQREGDLRGIDR